MAAGGCRAGLQLGVNARAGDGRRLRRRESEKRFRARRADNLKLDSENEGDDACNSLRPYSHFAAVLVSAIPGQARITRLVIEHTATLGKDGYQKLTGHAYGELDPRLPLNAITDLEFAPRNARGMVEYVATFTILKPADMAKASGVLLYFVPNRGRINPDLFLGGGFLADAQKLGHVLAASGWQADIEPADGAKTLLAPVARHPDGSPITGRVLAQFIDMPAATTTLPINRGGVAGTAERPPSTLPKRR
jgi:hypothetical protein